MLVAVVVPNFNSGELVSRTVRALLAQKVPSETEVTIVVVDDGSTDNSARLIESEFGTRVRMVRLGINRGRSTARNAGVAAIRSDIVIFVDSDCLPTNDQFIGAHVASARRGIQLSFGNITTPGPTFWDRLQRDSARWRLDALRQGQLWSFTTQNVAISRDLFDQSGGFDPVFDRHGFEDRDLFIKVAQLGAVVDFTEEARVIHADTISLASVARKLGDAGRHVAWEFDDLHPAEYSRMHFSKLDCRRRGWLRWLDRAAWPIARWIMAKPDSWLESAFVPFRARELAARTLYGLSFLHGTAERSRGRAAESRTSAIS